MLKILKIMNNQNRNHFSNNKCSMKFLRCLFNKMKSNNYKITLYCSKKKPKKKSIIKNSRVKQNDARINKIKQNTKLCFLKRKKKLKKNKTKIISPKIWKNIIKSMNTLFRYWSTCNTLNGMIRINFTIDNCQVKIIIYIHNTPKSL